MSKLKELIAELCPNGVEYKKLGDIASISRGGNFQKKDFAEGGVPCIHYGQIYTRYSLFADKAISYISEDAGKKSKHAEPNDIIMAVTRAYRIHINTGEVMPKYFYHYIRGTFLKYIKKNAVNSSVISIRRKMLDEYPVPVSSLEE